MRLPAVRMLSFALRCLLPSIIPAPLRHPDSAGLDHAFYKATKQSIAFVLTNCLHSFERKCAVFLAQLHLEI